MMHGPFTGRMFFCSGDGLLVSVSRESVVIWNVDNEEKFAEFPFKKWPFSVSFSPDGKYLAIGLTKTASIWNVRTRERITTFTPISSVFSISFSPDGMLLATGLPMSVCIWNVKKSHEICKIELKRHIIEFRTGGSSISITEIAFSPDGRYLAVNDSHSVVIWDIVRKKVIRELECNNKGLVVSLSFSPDGKYLSVGCNENVVLVYAWQKQELIAEFHTQTNNYDLSWLRNLFIYRSRIQVNSPFLEIRELLYTIAQSGRGFLALGDNYGRIEIIREGKEI